MTVGPIIDVRIHGFGAKHGGSYPDEVLEEWADWLRRGLACGRNAYVYFNNNDINGYTVYDAERLRLLVEGSSLGRQPMAKPAPQQNAAAYPPYPARQQDSSFRAFRAFRVFRGPGLAAALQALQ